MDYNKYYVYKEMVSYDSGQSWGYTGNETPSGDPIGTYDTLEECETSTGHTPTGYDCKLYVEYYTDDSHSATTEYIVPCNDSTTLKYDEVYDAIIDISHQFGDYPFIDTKLIVIGDCVETLNLWRPDRPYLDCGFKLGQGELVISPTVTKIYGLDMLRHYNHNIIRDVGKLTLYNTVREFHSCYLYISDELHIERGFLDNNILGLRTSRFGFNGGYATIEYFPKVYLSDPLPRYFPTGLTTGSLRNVTFIVPDDSVGYYAAATPYHDFVVSGQTGGGTDYRTVVGAIGTKENGDTVEYYLSKDGVLAATIGANIVKFNVVSPTKAIRNLEISDYYKLSALTVANSVKVIEDLKVDGYPSTGSTVLGNVSLPDGLWWMRKVFDSDGGAYMVDWKNILPLPSGLYLYWDCFRGDQCPGIDYNIDTLVIPDNCQYVCGITNYPWAQIDTISVGKKVESFLDAKANHFIFGQNLKVTNCSASGVTNVYPDSLRRFEGTIYYGGTYDRDFSFGTGIEEVFIGSYFNNKVYFKNSTPPVFSPATTNDNVTFYVPSGSAERYFEATHGLSSAFNPTIIEY